MKTKQKMCLKKRCLVIVFTLMGHPENVKGKKAR